VTIGYPNNFQPSTTLSSNYQPLAQAFLSFAFVHNSLQATNNLKHEGNKKIPASNGSTQA
jgi:hypothetical protein